MGYLLWVSWGLLTHKSAIIVLIPSALPNGLVK